MEWTWGKDALFLKQQLLTKGYEMATVMEVKWIVPGRGNAGRRGSVLTQPYAGFRKGHNGMKCSIRIPAIVMKEMRWQCGDHVAVGVCGLSLVLRRRPDGYMLSGSKRKDHGKACNCTVSVNISDKIRRDFAELAASAPVFFDWMCDGENLLLDPAPKAED